MSLTGDAAASIERPPIIRSIGGSASDVVGNGRIDGDAACPEVLSVNCRAATAKDGRSDPLRRVRSGDRRRARRRVIWR